MVMTRQRKHELSDAEIAAVELSDRKEYGAYVTYTALSRNGSDKYTTTLDAATGKCVGCTCPATVRDCRHGLAAEFEEEWTSNERREEELAGAAVIVGAVMPELAEDLEQHLDDMAEDEDEQLMGDIADAIIAAEYEAKVQSEVAETPDIDGGFFDEVWAMQDEKAAKLEPVSLVERKQAKRYGDDTKSFSLLKPA